LPIGLYTLMADLPGFATLKIENIRVGLNQHFDVGKLVLKVGSPSTELDVTAELNHIDTATVAVRSTMTEKQIRDLPAMAGILGRSIQPLLLAITPGASDYDNESSGASGKMSINGSPIGGLGFSLNGIDNTGFSIYGGGPISGGPNADAVGEFS